MLAVILSAAHVLALGIGLGSVFGRGRALRAVAAGDDRAVRGVLFADGLWGLAALLWIASGLLRAFGGFEKSPDFYVYNGFFWVKMFLFGAIFALEVLPMVTFVRWRIALRNGSAPDTTTIATLVRINDAETVLVMAIPFAAAAMARGLWLMH